MLRFVELQLHKLSPKFPSLMIELFLPILLVFLLFSFFFFLKKEVEIFAKMLKEISVFHGENILFYSESKKRKESKGDWILSKFGSSSIFSKFLALRSFKRYHIHLKKKSKYYIFIIIILALISKLKFILSYL